MKIALCGGEKGSKNYIAALEAVGLEPVLTRDPGKAADCAGLVLPGGGDVDPALYGRENTASTGIDRALDEAQLAAAERFVRAGKPVLGICKGLQLLNVLFGGTLTQDIPGGEVHRWCDGDSLHPCRSEAGSLLYRLYGECYTVNSAHHQAVDVPGRGFSVTGRAPDGVVEAIEQSTLPIVAVQWHPERLFLEHARPAAVDGGALLRWFRDML